MKIGGFRVTMDSQQCNVTQQRMADAKEKVSRETKLVKINIERMTMALYSPFSIDNWMNFCTSCLKDPYPMIDHTAQLARNNIIECATKSRSK